jgi:hypothetical protein
VSGGVLNTASGEAASVSGGRQNAANSSVAWVGGGRGNEAFTEGKAGEEGLFASIFGGKEHKTAIDYEATP